MKTFVRTIEETKAFTKNEWNRLSDEERETWQPEDGSPDWPEPEKKLSRAEKQLKMNKTAAKHFTESLRLKEGSTISFAGGKYKVLKWGPRQHLVHVKYNSGAEKYALMPRLVEDSSYGPRDIVKDYPVLNHLPDLKSAKFEYASTNK